MKEQYKPKFVAWAKSYENEVEILLYLIERNPSDLNLLKRELLELTGETYEEIRGENILSISRHLAKKSLKNQ